MNSEISILRAIYKKGGETSVKTLSCEIGFGLDYTRYIIDCLAKKKLVAASSKGREWFRLSSQGKKQLMRMGVIKYGVGKLPIRNAKTRPISIKWKRSKSVKKPIIKLAVAESAKEPNYSEESVEEIVITPPAAKTGKVILTHNLNEEEGESQELNIGKAIEKAAGVLKSFKSLLSSSKDKE